MTARPGTISWPKPFKDTKYAILGTSEMTATGGYTWNILVIRGTRKTTQFQYNVNDGNPYFYNFLIIGYWK